MSPPSISSDTLSSHREADSQSLAPITNEAADESKNVTHAKDCKVQLYYLKDDVLYKTVKPLQIVPGFADHEGKSNVKLEPGDLESLTDIRGTSNSFTLDNNGFQYIKSPTNFNNWTSQPAIAADYLPELENLLHRTVEGCDEIIFYDARIRHESDEGVRVEGLSYNPFARQVHVDNTEFSVLAKVKRLTEMKSDYLLKGRTRIINIWRPIKHPVYDCGLAVADGSTLNPEDVIECNRHRKDTGEFWDTMGVVKYRPGFDWFYMSEQTEEDVLLFKNYDSSNTAVKHCLHTAFDLPSDQIPASAPTRESIEVRALVFTYPTSEPKPAVIDQSISQHPLAVSLASNQLLRVDNYYSIVERTRTDIDEASELKDAELLLRRKKMEQMAKLQERAAEHLDIMQTKLESTSVELARTKHQLELANKQLQVQGGILAPFDGQNGHRALTDTITPSQATNEMDGLSQHLAETRVGISGNTPEYECTNESCQKEKINLLEHVEGQKHLVAQWKANSLERGMAAAKEVWVQEVARAVEYERKKDELAMHNLLMEIERLRKERDQALRKINQ
ncbi:Hypothetical protein R9X50_00070100 [Acrodontium crateriforme]|uniref:Uncharacterized protein n=1 Tax=Acrodontium crateriforme TaxID=150365 RepID=A0AAQ3LXT3_9PEZI|nr:Hypothetical protein R9X50_00070100 [Acrodontium crateriforme]